MKRILPFLLACLILAGCGTNTAPVVTETTEVPTAGAPLVGSSTEEIPYISRFEKETTITLSDSGIDVSGANSLFVFASDDIIYYEDRETYDSGNPYGEGEAHERHTADEAAAHTVVNITAPGAYRVTGKLSAGQIRIDLGEDAYEDPNAVVELILDNADITCTVAPAVLFLNVYECDGNWDKDTAQPNVDTSSAGANLILEGENYVSGSHVARIFKDKEEEKKLWKQDGALYSYMSMNVYGPGSLDLSADNEGLDTELHLTINGGDIAIRSDNDGINTNEDGVSVTTINGGDLHIIAGLGAEGDGIDSNGYLVINGGTVVSSANPASDAGLDSDLGSFVHGGTVIALGSAMDWAESDSQQITMNLQFSSFQSSGSAVVVTREDGTVIFAYDPSEDEVLGENTRHYQGAVISCPNFQLSESYYVYLDGAVTGSDVGGVYDVTTVTGYTGGTQMMYTGTDVSMRGPGGMGGGFGGQRPEGDPGEWAEGEMPTMPEGQEPPEGFGGDRGEWAEGEMPTMPEGQEPPEGFDGQNPPELPEGETMPDGWEPGQGGMNGPWGENRGEGGFPGQTGTTGEGNTIFYMQDKVNFFSGLTAAQ